MIDNIFMLISTPI